MLTQSYPIQSAFTNKEGGKMNKPDFETCTLQEACDYAVFKIVEQGGQCLSGKNNCVYGDGSGNHCAVGWLLDDSDEQLMNCGDAVIDLCAVYINSDGVPSVIQNNLVAFDRLQGFHDTGKATSRAMNLEFLSKHIKTTAPQYQQWVEMGE
jgi:hypothetical protein